MQRAYIRICNRMYTSTPVTCQGIQSKHITQEKVIVSVLCVALYYQLQQNKNFTIAKL